MRVTYHVVGGADLGLHQVIALRELGHVQITELRSAIRREEDVRRLQVSVRDVLGVEVHEALGHLHHVGPNGSLVNAAAHALTLLDSAREIPTFANLHHKAQLSSVSGEECGLIRRRLIRKQK